MTQHKWTAADIPEQRLKTIIVTGANSGLGFETTKTLVRKGAQVVMACRNMEKAKAAADQIRAELPGARLSVMALDLADLVSVREFSAAFQDSHHRLDILINNAGVMAVPKGKTVDGFERQFGINHLGHFALTGLLLEMLLKTPSSRIVTLSSYAHFFGWINFGDLNGEKFYQKWIAYCQSKLANVLFAYELNRRLSGCGDGTFSLAAHPGYAATHLQDSSWLFSLLNPIMAQSPEMGALNPLYAATHPDLHGGEYIGPDGFLAQRGYPRIARSSKASHDEALARRLWEVSEQLTGVAYL